MLLLAIDGNLTGNNTGKRQRTVILTAFVIETMWHTEPPWQKALVVRRRERRNQTCAMQETVGTKSYNPYHRQPVSQIEQEKRSLVLS